MKLKLVKPTWLAKMFLPGTLALVTFGSLDTGCIAASTDSSTPVQIANTGILNI
ncbi:hypothetical protein GCM10008018_12820 [Paenibacillus marchantiophytorum]|uniref:Uncharacterized protein n=1 Tax=Paenibacillus marchantiophytorum TaxID=1619310 RepID=A0ABQ2BT85_9BACL|nr:hypothetical protein [Paenibacillus marchantiophytorum]GGI45569.1 hypothetical protein GCM10008018_12820 [Paenibacillus marchantiophytorum]